MSNDDLPPPPVPADCDVRTLPSMMVDLLRLFDSELYHLSTGDQFKAAFTLWGKSFHQVPAGSLPNNERVLALMSGAGHAKWPRVREMALRGWELHADGRLYHPIVTEKVLEAWGMRQGQSKRAKAGWARRRKAVSGISPNQTKNVEPEMEPDNHLEFHEPADAAAMPEQCHGSAAAMQVNRSNSDELRSSAAEAAGEGSAAPGEVGEGGDLFGAPPPRRSLRAALFGEGLDKLAEMTGKPRDNFRSWLAKGLKETGDDAGLILAVIQEAHRRWLSEDEELADPKAWISKTVRARMSPKGGGDAPPPVPNEVAGWIVPEIVEECSRLMRADGDGCWRGFSGVIAEALATGADPDRHIYPVMRNAARWGVKRITSAGWFRAAISGLMQQTAVA